jgi:DNA-binding CsgD family transcriptional regulator
METQRTATTEESRPLTKCEIEVLQTAHDLATTDAGEIAAHLIKSVNTVRNQWASILEKLRVDRRDKALHLDEDENLIIKNTRIITRSGGGG